MSNSGPKPYPVVYDADNGLQYSFESGYQAISAGGSGGTVASAALINQNDDIPVTTLYTPSTTGLYRLSAYVFYTAGDGADAAASINWFWTDDGRAQDGSTFYAPSISQAGQLQFNGGNTAGPSAGSYINVVIEAVAGQPIQYQVFGGTFVTAVYSLYLAIEKIS